MEARRVKTFYRITKTNPPSDRDYITPYERRGAPPDDASEEVRESWYAFSAFDSIEGARNQARQIRGIGKYVFRYEVPEGIGITWKQTLGPGHYDLWGDKEILRSCEAGYVCDV